MSNLEIGLEQVILRDDGALLISVSYGSHGARTLTREHMRPEIARHLDLDHLRRDGVTIDDRRTVIPDDEQSIYEAAIAAAIYQQEVTSANH